jgi:hypothetical protein
LPAVYAVFEGKENQKRDHSRSANRDDLACVKLL